MCIFGRFTIFWEVCALFFVAREFVIYYGVFVYEFHLSCECAHCCYIVISVVLCKALY